MNIGIPKERRNLEYRVGLTPAGVQMLTHRGHTCYIERAAGLEAGFSDQEYINAGGHITYTAEEAFGRADLLLKIFRPTVEEIQWLKQGAVIAGLLHLGSARDEEIQMLSDERISAISYEQIQLPDGTFPVRTPLSQIGGRLSAQIGASLLQNNYGGEGIILGGIAGIPQAQVVIVGAGIVGTFATHGFVGMGANVTVLDTSLAALQALQQSCPNITTLVSNYVNLAHAIERADLVVGAVYVKGDRPPIVITREMVSAMKPRSVIMDICIDEGGCVETSRPTTHDQPTFIEEGVIHYCVPNIPSVVARSSTLAFLNAAFDYLLEITALGLDRALRDDPVLSTGLKMLHGEPLLYPEPFQF